MLYNVLRTTHYKIERRIQKWNVIMSVKNWSPYIDGELSSMEVQTIEAHLGGCKECTAERDKLTTTIESAHKVGDIQPAQNWWETLQKRLYAPRF